MSNTIVVTEFTDPYCTWCWGSEPMLRHLQEAYGDDLSLRFVMGGLVQDSKDFQDPLNGIGGEDWLGPIADHWVEASRKHGMPVDVTGFVTTKFTSTWPSNIAYHAAKLQDPRLADRYLRRLREAAALEGRDLSDRRVLVELAAESKLDVTRFEADFDGPARDAFALDRETCRERNVHGFPTFLIEVEGKERLLRGYRSYDQVAGTIEMLGGPSVEHRVPEFSDLNVADFIERYGSAAVREVVEVFGVPDAAAHTVLRRLVDIGAVEPTANGMLFRAPSTPVCDTASGECR